MNPDKHYIVCAAIHHQYEEVYPHQPFNIKNGYVICGLRHPNCIVTFGNVLCSEKFIGDVAHINTDIKKVQGFLTSHNLFVDRQEAYIIAEACGQLENRKVHKVGTLFSEDLY